MPALMSELNQLIASSTRDFFWAGPGLEISNIYFEGPGIDLVPHYLSEFHNARERDSLLSFSEAMVRYRGSPAGDFMQRYLKVTPWQFRASDIYSEFFRPCRMGQGICLHAYDGPRPVGALYLWRDIGERSFTSRDLRLLDHLHGFIAHGLRSGPTRENFADTDDHAPIVLDRGGRLLHVSAEAHRLLLMMLAPRWAPDTTCRMRLAPPPELIRLLERLLAARTDRVSSLSPVLRQRNAWGEFVLRAHFLEAVHAHERSRLVGVTIERREPESLVLWRKIEELQLSHREKQLCLLLTKGYDAASAARTMGVSNHTVRAQRRSIYQKLGVEGLLALIERLRAS